MKEGKNKTKAKPLKDKRILVVDDHPIVSEGVAALLSRKGKASRIIKAKNGNEALRLAASDQIDIVIADFSLPDLVGTELISRLRKIHPEIHVVVYTSHDEPWLVKEMMDIGAEAVVLKNDDMEELFMAAESVCAGLPYFSNRFAAITKLSDNSFSPREIDILECMAKGMKSRDIASQLFISENTVEYHRKKLKQRFEAQNEANLIAIAINKGIIKG